MLGREKRWQNAPSAEVLNAPGMSHWAGAPVLVHPASLCNGEVGLAGLAFNPQLFWVYVPGLHAALSLMLFLSCRERHSKNAGSGGEVNRNAKSLEEVRWNITTEASLLARWEQDHAAALRLLPLTHLPSAFPCLQRGKRWLGWWGRAQQCAWNGSRASVLCLGKRVWRRVRLCAICEQKRNQNSLWHLPGNLVPTGQLPPWHTWSVPDPEYRLRRIPACL